MGFNCTLVFHQINRVEILREQSAKQKEDLNLIKDEKQTLRSTIEMLAEKYEDVKDRQEYILKRYNLFFLF